MELLRTKGEERLRKVWRQMRSRCANPKDPKYAWYGGRNIVVCADWNTYPEFREWALAAGFVDGLSIERMNNDGPYSPENCRWIPLKDQARNKSNTLRFEAFG